MNIIKQRFIHMSPRKLRRITDVVRGKTVKVALATLKIMPQAAATILSGAIKSAVSAVGEKGSPTDMYINSIYVDEGPALKRRIMKSRGRATRMEHRMSHITIGVAPLSPQLRKSKV